MARVQPPRVAILAAGSARRFGGNKLEAPCAGKPLGRWVIDAVEAARFSPGMIIVGEGGARFAEGTRWEQVFNPRAAEGLGTSVALAARTASRTRALLVLLADMPLVDAEFIFSFRSRLRSAATRYPDGHAGVPALFDRALIEQAAHASGDRGLGPMLRSVDLLDAPPGMLRDVDTAEDLAEAERQLLAR